MAFPFPLNPVDGQQVTQAQPDGSVLVATYNQAKNEWVINRQLPAPTPITGTPPINVTATADGQVITWDQALRTWTAKTPAAQSGGVGGTFVKGTQAGPDTTDPPSPGGKPLVAGMLQSTLENLHKEVKAWDGSAWTEVFGEDTIKQWISAGSLFRGVVKEATLSTLPAPATANRGFYFSWTGNPGYVVKAADPGIGTDLVGEILQVGDWVQSDGAKWVHVPGDLLSKQRWDSLGSFTSWSDTSWEKGSVVSYQKAFFRANALISPGDLPPGDPGSKWTDITPLPHMKLEELEDCHNLAAANDMQVPAWDAVNSEWVPTQLALNDLSDVNADVTDPASNGAVFQWDLATQQWVAANTLALRLEDLGDTGQLGGATAGQVPSWDAAASEWKPLSVINPIPYFTGKYGPGTLSGGTTWVQWPNAKEGDIWVNKNTTPPHFEVYENGAWKVWNFATETRSLGLLGDLANVDLGSKAPGNGDALIWNVKKEQWVSGNTPAHIAQYTASSVYSDGTTVYYKGGIFKATRAIAANESPEFLTGDVFLFYRAQADGSGDFGGPYRVFRVEKVADATLPPTFTPPTNGKTNCVCYKDDRNWSVWEWVMVDFVNLTYGWVCKDGAYTKRTLWRSHFLPTKNKGTFVLWVVDDTKGTTVPKAREYPWEMLPIRGDLAALHDCHVDDPQDGDALVFNGTTNLWEPKKAKALAVASLSDVTLTGVADKQVLQYDLATTSWKNWTPDYLNPQNGYTKTEVDSKLTAIVTGLNHEVAVLAIADTPPAAPSIGQLYIVGATPTGVWVGQANNLSRWDGTAWQFTTPRNKEAHLVEDQAATYTWNNTAWVKVASASTGGANDSGDIWQVGSIQQSMLTETQWATLLGPVEGAKWVLADGRNCAGTKYAQVTGKTSLPDLRGAFLRSAGQNNNKSTKWNGGDVGQWYEDSTALPKTPFVTTNEGNHSHSFKRSNNNFSGDGKYRDAQLSTIDASGGGSATGGGIVSAGAHSHNVTGGDAQTAPVHVAVNVFIKIN